MDMEFGATLPRVHYFLNFAKRCVLSCLSKFDDIKNFTMPFFEIQELKAKIKGVFSRSQGCHGTLLFHKHDNNVFTNDWLDF